MAGVMPPPAFLANSANAGPAPRGAHARRVPAGRRWGAAVLAQGLRERLLGRGGEERPGTSASLCLGLPSERRLAPPRPAPPRTAEGRTAAAVSLRPARRGRFSRHRRQRSRTASRPAPARQRGSARRVRDTTRVSGEGDPAPVGGAGRVASEGPGCPPREGGKKSKLVMSYYFFLWQCSESLQMSAC